MTTLTYIPCPRCDGTRVGSMRYGGRPGHWIPQPCPDCCVCPDPDGHARLHGQREQTWREPIEAADGCRWCGKRVDERAGLCDVCSEPTPDPPICTRCFDAEERRWPK